jgi:hypothetical protein
MCRAGSQQRHGWVVCRRACRSSWSAMLLLMVKMAATTAIATTWLRLGSGLVTARPPRLGSRSRSRSSRSSNGGGGSMRGRGQSQGARVWTRCCALGGATSLLLEGVVRERKRRAPGAQAAAAAAAAARGLLMMCSYGGTHPLRPRQQLRAVPGRVSQSGGGGSSSRRCCRRCRMWLSYISSFCRRANHRQRWRR